MAGAEAVALGGGKPALPRRTSCAAIARHGAGARGITASASNAAIAAIASNNIQHAPAGHRWERPQRGARA